jgi:hypothetical protein
MALNSEIFGRTSSGSNMPLDTELHWTWRNPLNVLLVLLVLFMIAALIGAIIA